VKVLAGKAAEKTGSEVTLLAHLKPYISERFRAAKLEKAWY
jgi:hypothetical protein